MYGRFERGLPHGLEPLASTFRDHVLRRTAPEPAPTPGPAPAPAPAEDPSSDDYRARHHAPYTPPVLRARPDGSTPAFHTTTVTLDADRTRALRHLARTAGTTLHAPVLTAYYRALTTLTGRRDLVLGLAVTGRDGTTDDAHRVFGPFAEAVALRPAPYDDAHPVPGFDEDLRRITAETLAARATGPLDLRTPQGLPRTAQFFFTFLDFSSLGAPPDTTLSLRADDSDTELTPPPVGTDVFLAVRPSPDGEGLSITARASSKAVTSDELARFTRLLMGELEGPGHRDNALDAALIGYLPTPHQLAAFAGLPAHAVPSREQLRALLFPDGRPRVLESLTTPLGRSGFVSLPLFADELTAPTMPTTPAPRPPRAPCPP